MFGLGLFYSEWLDRGRELGHAVRWRVRAGRRRGGDREVGAPALLGLGARVTVTDADPDRLGALDAPGADLVPGLTSPPAGTDLVVTSPGCARTTRCCGRRGRGRRGHRRRRAGLRIAQDQPTPAAWLVVTGTNGKTTTVSMLEQILLAAGARAVACGNVGLPVLDAVLAGLPTCSPWSCRASSCTGALAARRTPPRC